jgi:uncharacterized membrane protein
VYPAGILESVGLHAHLASAVVPFVVALMLRFLLGRSRFTTWLVSLSVMWFAINVLMAPYSLEAQREIESLGAHFR